MERAAEGQGSSPTSGPSAEELEEQRDREILGEWHQHPGLGPSQIRNQLRRRGVKVCVQTVRRVMEDAGYQLPMVRSQRHDERFEAVRPNHMWHLDSLHRHINRAQTHTLILLDDCSRYVVGHGTDDAERADLVIKTFFPGAQWAGDGSTMTVEIGPCRFTFNVELLVDADSGAFGLFKQTAPPLVVVGNDRKEIARQLVALVIVTWARTLNNQPRSDRGRASRVELYNETEPTAEQVERVRKALLERQRRQERRLEKAKARMDPDALLRAAIDDAMAAHRNLDRLFWLQFAAKLITDQDTSLHPELVRNASRRIQSFFAVPYWDRLTAVRFLTNNVVSLA